MLAMKVSGDALLTQLWARTISSYRPRALSRVPPAFRAAPRTPHVAAAAAADPPSSSPSSATQETNPKHKHAAPRTRSRRSRSAPHAGAPPVRAHAQPHHSTLVRTAASRGAEARAAGGTRDGGAATGQLPAGLPRHKRGGFKPGGLGRPGVARGVLLAYQRGLRAQASMMDGSSLLSDVEDILGAPPLLHDAGDFEKLAYHLSHEHVVLEDGEVVNLRTWWLSVWSPEGYRAERYVYRSLLPLSEGLVQALERLGIKETVLQPAHTIPAGQAFTFGRKAANVSGPFHNFFVAIEGDFHFKDSECMYPNAAYTHDLREVHNVAGGSRLMSFLADATPARVREHIDHLTRIVEEKNYNPIWRDHRLRQYYGASELELIQAAGLTEEAALHAEVPQPTSPDKPV